MLKLGDLDNRVYSGKRCIGFQVHIVDNNGKQLLEATFKKDMEHPSDSWAMQVLFQRTIIKDTEVYNFVYQMPKYNMPLEMVAATGLRYLQSYLRHELDNKSLLCFAIDDTVEGM